ncbi:hypothetical protein M9Y10_013405 [Tritrichomonas musculus]|uniref:Protein kinase domain-containing protein n=1 Tax=Tritrichomonas musculus TaxID=1915356 RepID=A0ABR2I839_9EUKA
MTKNIYTFSPQIAQFEVDPKNYTDAKEKTFRGGCGVAFFVIDNNNKKKYVNKRTLRKLSSRPDDFDTKIFIQEVTTFALYRHPAIVPFIGYAIDEKRYGNIYLEYMENGSLDQYIEKKSKDPLFDDTHKLIISYGIARAMKFLHSHRILHRDLKSENILLDTQLRPYITDFGTSKASDSSKQTSQTVQQTTACIMPPEFVTDYLKFNRTFPIDVYSYAMVLYHLWTEQTPYPKDSSISFIIQKTLDCDRPKFPSNSSLSENWQKLITQCWDKDPVNRPTFSEICDRLETNDFITPDINKELFDTYKSIIDLAPTSSPKTVPQVMLEEVAKE